MYQGLDYNGEFRKFFSGLFTKYAVSDAGDRDLLHEIARDFVEANRDFVMQYPLVSYWSELSPEEIYTALEQRLAEPYEGQKVNLYFHIPFCKTRCTYCNFHIVTGEGRIRAAEKLYLHMMLREARLFRDRLDSLQVETCFIGGGTPSYLSIEWLRTLLSGIRDIFGADFQSHTEYTFEGNPDSYTPEKMAILREFWVNRISLGMQTFDDDILRAINRTYTGELLEKRIREAREIGFTNINIDMMYGLPGHTIESMRSDLQIAKSLDVSHLTYYPLYYYDAATLGLTGRKESNIESIYAHYDDIVKELSEVGYTQYGREYFSRDTSTPQSSTSLEHHYQGNYVSDQLLIGFGQSAYSYNGQTAFYKDQDLGSYMKRIDPIVSLYDYDDESRTRRLIVLGSRNRELLKSNITSFPGLDILLEQARQLGYLRETPGSYILTDHGLKYQEIFAHIFV